MPTYLDELVSKYKQNKNPEEISKDSKHDTNIKQEAILKDSSKEIDLS